MNHITIFVACIFGLFSILSLLDRTLIQIRFLILSIVYWSLFFGGLYSLIKFTVYLRISNYLVSDIGGYKRIKKIEGVSYSYERYALYDKKLHWIIRYFYKKLINFSYRKYIILIGGFLYSLIVAFSYLAILYYRNPS